ncbi:MAG: diguanylate cyclase, partial [Rhizobiales bacterium]|nr:diguanylate cyclase [Hyphomicrobiales bacterium]
MHVFSDSGTALIYFAIAPLIATLLHVRCHAVTRTIALLLSAVPLACGLTHLGAFLLAGDPMQSLQAAVELMAAAIAVAVITLFWSGAPGDDRPSPVALADENDELRREIERQRSNLDYLRRAHQDLEHQVETTTTALGLAYEKLNANRQRLAFALEGANDGLWDWKLKEETIYLSARLAEMLGHGRSEMTVSVRKRWALIHRDDRAQALKAFHDHIEGQAGLYESEHRLSTRHGRDVWVLDRGKVVERDHLGRAVRAVGTTSDISRRKTAELALQTSSERIRRLYEETPALLYSVDADGRLLSVTRHWLRAMGYRQDEVLGRRSISFMTPETQRRLCQKDLPIFRDTGRLLDAPCQMVRKNGEIFDALLSVTAEHGGDGKVIRSLAVLVDVTERNAALRRLEQSEARLRLALEGAREGIWDWDGATGELYLSPQACHILGFAPGEPPGDIGFWQLLLPAVDRARFAAGIDDLCHGRIPSLVCEQELTPPGRASVWIDWRASSVEAPPGRATRRIVGIFRDITARKRAELQTAYRAQHDSLTGLANRSAYQEQLQRAHAEAELTGRPLAVMFLDLDRFKAVNDSFGHDCGDQLLIEVGRRLQDCLRKTDLVARFGGDEFAILARGYKSARDIDRLAKRIIDTIAEPIALDGRQVEIGVSIGITSFPQDRSPAEDLITNADLALYRAKQSGPRHLAALPSEHAEPASERPDGVGCTALRCPQRRRVQHLVSAHPARRRSLHPDARGHDQVASPDARHARGRRVRPGDPEFALPALPGGMGAAVRRRAAGHLARSRVGRGHRPVDGHADAAPACRQSAGHGGAHPYSDRPGSGDRHPRGEGERAGARADRRGRVQAPARAAHPHRRRRLRQGLILAWPAPGSADRSPEDAPRVLGAPGAASWQCRHRQVDRRDRRASRHDRCRHRRRQCRSAHPSAGARLHPHAGQPVRSTGQGCRRHALDRPVAAAPPSRPASRSAASGR